MENQCVEIPPSERGIEIVTKEEEEEELEWLDNLLMEDYEVVLSNIMSDFSSYANEAQPPSSPKCLSKSLIAEDYARNDVPFEAKDNDNNSEKNEDRVPVEPQDLWGIPSDEDLVDWIDDDLVGCIDADDLQKDVDALELERFGIGSNVDSHDCGNVNYASSEAEILINSDNDNKNGDHKEVEASESERIGIGSDVDSHGCRDNCSCFDAELLTNHDKGGHLSNRLSREDEAAMMHKKPILGDNSSLTPIADIPQSVVGPMGDASFLCPQSSPWKSRKRKQAGSTTRNYVTDEIPEYNPQAVIDWAKMGSEKKNGEMTARTKKHLLAVGWKLWRYPRETRSELRYESPGRRISYNSLITACRICCKDDRLLYGGIAPTNGTVNGKEVRVPSACEFSSGKKHIEIDKSTSSSNRQSEINCTDSFGSLQSGKRRVKTNIKQYRRSQEMKNNTLPIAAGLDQTSDRLESSQPGTLPVAVGLDQTHDRLESNQPGALPRAVGLYQTSDRREGSQHGALPRAVGLDQTSDRLESSQPGALPIAVGLDQTSDRLENWLESSQPGALPIAVGLDQTSDRLESSQPGADVAVSHDTRQLPTTKQYRRRKDMQNNNTYPLAVRLDQTSDMSQSSQHGDVVEVSQDTTIRQPVDHNDDLQEQKRRKLSDTSAEQGKRLNDVCKIGPRVSCNARGVVPSSSIHSTPRKILSSLIDYNVVSPMDKVYYVGGKDQRRMAEGWITREGIKCICHEKIFTLSNFEAHAGSTNHRPAANIFLEDGRSLTKCQEQMKMARNSNPNGFVAEKRERIKRKRPCNDDSICSICHQGGYLILSDHCPTAFHPNCLELMVFPKGKWFCPCCRCGICEESDYNGDTEQFTDNSALYCDQCEREYHVGCLREERMMKLESCPKGNWFCSEKCEQIFSGLQKVAGKSNLVGSDKLSWTILKSLKQGSDASEGGTTIELHSKLNEALGALHECFEPYKDPYTNRDIVEDILLNSWSPLPRVNCWGFYTVLLEREDEVISVATVRVHGEKVAEIPPIGTRSNYRGQGMLRILMDVLEKKLAELGVEKVVLPAIPKVIDTWITSFGFSEMTDWERLELLEYPFLDFPKTTMCQKILETPRPTKKSPESINNQQDLLGEMINSVDSEVIQAELTDQIEVEKMPREILVN